MRIRLVPLMVFFFAPAAPAAAVEYLRDIKPLLVEKCISCHGPVREEAGLRLDAAALIQRGGDSGSVVAAGDPDGSYLLERVTAGPLERMPPEEEGEPLSAEQIALLRQWIADGLPAPEDEQPLSEPKDHWAYQPIRRPPVPGGEEAAGRQHPIDRFLAARQREQGVEAAGRADAATLLRRVMLDLVGLPPQRAELARFLADDSPAAYRRMVDQLLESPQYGERWGRHWMDVWRYSDWDGYKNQLRGSQRHIWHWRDWIIESLNEDKGYDQMIVEMIAGDELAPEDPDTLRATGFLARNYHHSNRDIWLDATVEHTAKAFLGMTIACARCHDHKYDPLSQREYYAFRAIFEPHQVRTRRVPGEPDVARDGLPRVYDADLKAETYLYIRGNEKMPDKENPLAPAVPAIFERPLEIEAVPLPLTAFFPAAAPHIEQEDLAAADRRREAARRRLAELQTTDAGEQRVAELAVAVAEAERVSLAARWDADRAKHTGQPESEFQRLAAEAAGAERQLGLQRAELEVAEKELALAQARRALVEAQNALAQAQSGEDAEEDLAKRQATIDQATKELETARKALAKAEAAAGEPGDAYTPVGEVYPRTSTGRRLALAKWIASPENPLTARVAVNHIWLRHFGAPLVENVFDFGLQASRPEHAELLDWLAAELIDSGWSMKHLHRTIVTSEAYQADSRIGDRAELVASAEIDPDNALFWRANARRLDAEVIRDSLFYLAGSLDLKLGGPEIPASDGETVPRRSLYFQHAYEKQMKMLTLFDAASPNECYRRSESILPQQALVLSNSAVSLSQARQLARQLSQQPGDSDDARQAFIRAAFEQVLARPPSAQEQRLCEEFLDRQRQLLAGDTPLTASAGKAKPQRAPSPDPAMRARENLVHVLMNHNDFVTIR